MDIKQGDEIFTVINRERVTGCGSKFDGRVKFYLRRYSDGKMFTWLGNRQSKRVPHNAKLREMGV